MATAKNNPLFNAVADDHQEMYQYYDEYVRNKGNTEAQTKWSNQLIWEIARHAVGEEIVIYPLMERHLGQEGVKLADHDRDDHQFVKENLYKLESMNVGTPEYDGLLRSVMDHLHEHNDSEETQDLPQLFQAIGADRAQAAALDFKRTKKFAPTHPHPAAPNKPPFETVAGLMAAPLDLLRDTFQKFPSHEEKEAAEHRAQQKN
ncbi:HHE domain-containing protein [Coprinellus micaceus]|uniref:HHE domain-containing protein n=1 Tax=Coprinellus micaceus TaxID=71717 RepID=A0A4Y7T9C3_COPMI|nr:HHE domain-containing protein [Coprinellus micaceus]